MHYSKQKNTFSSKPPSKLTALLQTILTRAGPTFYFSWQTIALPKIPTLTPPDLVVKTLSACTNLTPNPQNGSGNETFLILWGFSSRETQSPCRMWWQTLPSPPTLFSSRQLRQWAQRRMRQSPPRRGLGVDHVCAKGHSHSLGSRNAARARRQL